MIKLLKTLQDIQQLYCKYIDMSIETRRDKNAIGVHICAYDIDEDDNIINSSKLYTFIFKHNDDNELEIQNLLNKINLLYTTYICKENSYYFKLKKEDI